MTSIRTFVVDDEPLARTSLKILLERDPEIQLAGECGSGAEAIQSIRAMKPDLLFLDVRMPDVDGFEILEALGSAVPPCVVFVTAFDEYAVRAFDADAVDYLLKPFDDQRFAKALARAKESIRQHSAAGRLIVRNAGRILFIRISEIDWIEAADYYACLHVSGRSHLLRRTLADLERTLNPSQFCRIHRSTIVNVERVRELRLDYNGEYEVVLLDSTTLRMSRTYRNALQSLISRES
jgi:two-component system LytT family response regulator